MNLTVVVHFSPPHPRNLWCPSFPFSLGFSDRAPVQVWSVRLRGGGTKVNDHGNLACAMKIEGPARGGAGKKKLEAFFEYNVTS